MGLDKRILRGLVYFCVVLSLVIFSGFASMGMNVYLHEMGHAAVAEYYGLEPRIHIDDMFLVEGEFRFNLHPRAYTTFSDPGDTAKNIWITLAGPLVNIGISILFAVLYTIFRSLVMRRLRRAAHKGRIKEQSHLITLCFFVDVIFISMLVPAIISAVVNLSDIPGSDGAFLRELMR